MGTTCGHGPAPRKDLELINEAGPTRRISSLRKSALGDRWKVSYNPDIFITIKDLQVKCRDGTTSYDPSNFSLEGLGFQVVLEVIGTKSEIAELGGTMGRTPSRVSTCSSVAGLPHKVKIVRARGLRNADASWIPGKGVSDPYCICELQNVASSKFKTQVIKNNLNPRWDHEGEIPIPTKGDQLLFSVWDKDHVTEDDFLGKATLSWEAFHPFGFEGELLLAEAGKGIEAYLQVSIGDVAASHTFPIDVEVNLKKELSEEWVVSEVCQFRTPKDDIEQLLPIARVKEFIADAVARSASALSEAVEKDPCNNNNNIAS